MIHKTGLGHGLPEAIEEETYIGWIRRAIIYCYYISLTGRNGPIAYSLLVGRVPYPDQRLNDY